MKRTDGKTKLTPEMRQRLAEVARDARRLVYGEQQCPDWGTSFAEIETDAREVGHEFIRLLMEQTSSEQARIIPASALVTETGEAARLTGSGGRTLETESGPVHWDEPQAYLSKSRKAFFPSESRVGPANRRGSLASGHAQDRASGDETGVV